MLQSNFLTQTLDSIETTQNNTDTGLIFIKNKDVGKELTCTKQDTQISKSPDQHVTSSGSDVMTCNLQMFAYNPSIIGSHTEGSHDKDGYFPETLL